VTPAAPASAFPNCGGASVTLSSGCRIGRGPKIIVYKMGPEEKPSQERPPPGNSPWVMRSSRFTVGGNRSADRLWMLVGLGIAVLISLSLPPRLFAFHGPQEGHRPTRNAAAISQFQAFGRQAFMAVKPSRPARPDSPARAPRWIPGHERGPCSDDTFNSLVDWSGQLSRASPAACASQAHSTWLRLSPPLKPVGRVCDQAGVKLPLETGLLQRLEKKAPPGAGGSSKWKGIFLLGGPWKKKKKKIPVQSG